MKKLPKKASRNKKAKYIFDEIQRKIIIEKDIVMSIFLIAVLLLGHGRPPTRKKPGSDWQYLQMVKQRDEHGRFQGTKLRVIFGTKAEVIELLGKSTAYIERSNLTSRLFNSRQVRKTLAFSKDIEAYRAAATWEDSYYNLVRPHKSLRLFVQDDPSRKWSPRTPALIARLTDHIWTVKELLTTLSLPNVTHT
jgi:hypothetical protein